MRRLLTKLAALALAAALGGCAMGSLPPSQWVVLGGLAAVAPQNAYRLQSGLSYGPERRERLDVYTPAQRAPGPRPVVVWAYGGSLQRGERGVYGFIGEAFTRLGYPTVIFDYRLYPTVPADHLTDDPALALAWVARHAAEFGGDGTRIILAGHSAGAFLWAALSADPARLLAAGVNPADVAAVLGISGAYALKPPYPKQMTKMLNAMPDPAALQPISYAKPGGPPFILLHGSKDDTLSVENARAFVVRLRALGRAVEYQEYANADHYSLLLYLSSALRDGSLEFSNVRAALARLNLDPW